MFHRDQHQVETHFRDMTDTDVRRSNTLLDKAKGSSPRRVFFLILCKTAGCVRMTNGGIANITQRWICQHFATAIYPLMMTFTAQSACGFEVGGDLATVRRTKILLFRFFTQLNSPLPSQVRLFCASIEASKTGEARTTKVRSKPQAYLDTSLHNHNNSRTSYTRTQAARPTSFHVPLQK